MGWPGPMTDLQFQVWQCYLRWRSLPPGEPDLDMDGLVPPETQERWRNKVSGAHHRMPELSRRLREAQERSARAEADVARARAEAARQAEYERQKFASRSEVGSRDQR